MVKRQLQAVAAGICIAIIAQESTWIAFDVLDPARSLNDALAEAPLSNGWLAPLLLSWALGGVLGGLMATLVGQSRFSGYATGLSLSASALALLWICLPGAGGFLAVALTPGIGAALGAWLGLLLERAADKHERISPASIVTLRFDLH